MKYINNTIKSTLTAVAVMAIGSSAFGALLIDEEWDGPTYPDNFVYGEVAVATYSIDNGSVLSGANSLKVDITNSGGAGEWWALQVARTGITLAAGDVLDISFEIKSTVALGFWSRVEGDAAVVPNGSVNDWVAVAAGETKTISYQTLPMVGNGAGTFMLAMGESTPVPGEVWIDNLQVDVIPEPATFGLMGLAAAVLIGARRFRM